ncbi:MAG: amidohydrolase family protein [Clostridia bacterium]|nr:amidohydrolase family protein [Clostridia bacterium]
MKIFDMHIHALNTEPDPDGIIEKMDKAGVFGGCIFSNWPERYNQDIGTSFDERLNEVMAWCRGYEDRLFPVMWIHPYEKNIIENIHKAVNKGICGFKIICADFYVYEEECMKVLREIASLNKPVFFHSGILWDAKVSSEFNRPLNWEALMDIEGLRFSMGHCSWPWIDECIAMYGKFLNSLTRRNTAEMFFDITPGTPEIYREELITKLFNIGYDVGDNIMFGTDAEAHRYNSNWAEQWLDADRKILDRLGVSKKFREKLYHDNLMRFLGKADGVKNHESPVSDSAQRWSAENKAVYKVIEKWYKELKFPNEYDREFYNALNTIKISDAITIENYDVGETDGKRNLLSFLFMCEELEKQYIKKGIDREILIDTLEDIVRWTITWSNVKGELYLGELSWLKRHFEMKLFKLGRLQFCMAGAERDTEGKGIKKGDAVIEVHIPAGEPLDEAECRKSIALAVEFFEKFYPDYNYKYYTCHSWLLDKTLDEFLPPDSNILKFGNMFDIVAEETGDDILRYVFDWNTTRLNVKSCVCVGSFDEKIKKAALKGREFYVNLGVIKKEEKIC